MTIVPIISVLVGIIVYFIPWGLAKSRNHSSADGIGLLNLLAGWTIIGWFAALIWAASGKHEPKAKAGEYIQCPDCAETIKAAARVCRHCGHKLVA